MKKTTKGTVRLDKYLADNGAGTRSEVKDRIRKNRVTVNGQIVRQPEMKIDPENDRVELDQKWIRPHPEFVYYLLNKPAGYVSATTDPKEKTVLDLIGSDAKGLFPVGRLDKDTEGLLLITNDGALSHQLLSPNRHVDKTYYVETERPLTGEEAARLEEGVDIGEKRPTLPARAELLPPEGEKGRLHLTIHEGKFHQVKRMIHAVGTEVTYLRRISMGNLILPDDLPGGKAVEIDEESMKKSFTDGQ